MEMIFIRDKYTSAWIKKPEALLYEPHERRIITDYTKKNPVFHQDNSLRNLSVQDMESIYDLYSGYSHTSTSDTVSSNYNTKYNNDIRLAMSSPVSFMPLLYPDAESINCSAAYYTLTIDKTLAYSLFIDEYDLDFFTGTAYQPHFLADIANAISAHVINNIKSSSNTFLAYSSKDQVSKIADRILDEIQYVCNQFEFLVIDTRKFQSMIETNLPPKGWASNYQGDRFFSAEATYKYFTDIVLRENSENLLKTHEFIVMLQQVAMVGFLELVTEIESCEQHLLSNLFWLKAYRDSKGAYHSRTMPVATADNSSRYIYNLLETIVTSTYDNTAMLIHKCDTGNNITGLVEFSGINWKYKAPLQDVHDRDLSVGIWDNREVDYQDLLNINKLTGHMNNFLALSPHMLHTIRKLTKQMEFI